MIVARDFALASDRDPNIRYQLALTLGLREGEWRILILAELFTQRTDAWIESAALKALGGSAGIVFDTVANAKPAPSTELLKSLATIIGKTGKTPEVAAVRNYAKRTPEQKFQILAALASGLGH